MPRQIDTKQVYIMTTDPDWRQELQKACKAKGFRVAAFSNPNSLIGAAQEEHFLPGAIIVDYKIRYDRMPAEQVLSAFAGKSRETKTGLKSGLEQLGIGLVVTGFGADENWLRRLGGGVTQISWRPQERLTTDAHHFTKAAEKAVDAAQKAMELAMLEKIGVKQQAGGRSPD